MKVDGRSQHQNRREAFDVLRVRLQDAQEQADCSAVNQQRATQVGSGERGDKIRTYREQDGRVSDHRTSKCARLSDVLKGRLELLD